MRPTSSDHPRRAEGDGAARAAAAGWTVLEVLVALAITAVLFASLHLTMGGALRSKLLASSWMASQQQGRLAAAWLADRVRQAGFRADPGSLLARCRDAIVASDPAYWPTASSLHITADVDDDGTAETRGFQIQTVGGVPAITETVAPCLVGAVPVSAPLTDVRSVEAQSLTFAYYTAAGAPVTALTDPAAIRTIRIVEVTVALSAAAGAQGPTTQTWRTHIALRNP